LTPAGHGDRGRPGWRWEGAVGTWVDLKRKKTGQAQEEQCQL
jgi:hypothetical protein